MARKIKETPVLTGKSMERFNREIKANEQRKLSDVERKKIMEAAKRFTLEPA